MLEYIIVQAGGKGTRMETLTRNKPKALVPVNNLPMIFHLFRKYPDKKYIIIGDYQYDVLINYLKAFAETDYRMVRATGHTGTCAGLSEALSYIPDNQRFMLIWCDLVLPKEYEFPESEKDIIGIAKDFPCRWKYENGTFTEEMSRGQGVAGHFIFHDKSVLAEVPAEGELVRWMQSQGITFEEQELWHTREYGLYSEWDKLPKTRCRPFNRVHVEGDKFYKEPIDEQGRQLAVRERAWYRKLKGICFENIPAIYDYEPLCMERVEGKNLYEYRDLPLDLKKRILTQIIECLKKVHELGSIPADRDSYYDAYIAKTFERLKKVRRLVPFAGDRYVTVNGKRCRNVFFHREELENMVMAYMPEEFKLIHGDCTFSNMMLKKDTVPMLIDPRGYFGKTEIFGDVAYDWVKLYYSLYSNYDQFNLKRFELVIKEKEVTMKVDSNQWEELEGDFFRLLEGEVTRHQMKLYLAVVWLSLTTYAWEDYDSICGAFYNGLWYLEDVLS